MSNEPIYRQVMKDVEARAEVGKKTYGRYLMPDTNGRDPVQDAYEEALDMAKYLKQTGHERRALLEYVARLEGAIKGVLGNWNRGVLPVERHDTFEGGQEMKFLSPAGAMLDSEVVVELIATLATSPLAGQPQSAPATGWRPIAEAPRDGTPIEVGDPDSGWVRVVQYAAEAHAWYLLGSGAPYYAFDSFTVFRPLPVVPAPPQEGE